MSLAQRLFLLVVLALLPALAILAYNELDLRRVREAEIRDLARRQAELAASELNQILTGVRNLLITVAEVPSVRALDTTVCVPFLATLHLKVPHLATITAFDLEGRVRCREQMPAQDLDHSDRAYFQAALASGDFVVGEYTDGRLTPGPVLPLALPLRDLEGRIIGVVAAALDLAWLTRHLRERTVTPGGSITVADRNGVIIAREPLPERFLGTRIPDEFQRLVQAAAPGALELMSQDGTRRVLGYVPARATPAGVYVSAGLSSTEAFAAVDRATTRGLALIAAGLLLALVAVGLLGRHFFARPVGRLLATADRWRAGDYSQRTGLSSWRGEFGALGLAFDRMAEEIGRREAEQERTTAALRESEARFRTVADSAPVLIWMSGSDDSGRTWFNRAWLDLTGRRLEQEQGRGWLAGVHPHDLPALAAYEDAFAARQPFTTEFRLRRHDGAWRWMLDTGVPRFGSDGGFLGFIGSCVDLTERKGLEAQQALLLQELSHRVKNTLAVVRGIASQSLSGERTLPEARHTFDRRLRALASAHGLLTAGEWRGAGLHDLVTAELAPYGERVAITGENVMLGPKAALTLGLALHELATNAAKYGALSTVTGRLDIAWGLVEPEAGRTGDLRLCWRECHGPRVQPSSRRGFGLTLIEQGLRHDLDGTVTLDFRPEGLVCEIVIPGPAHR